MTRTYDAAYLERLQTLLADAKQHSYALLDARPGEVVVDVGCGLGHDAAALAATGATVIGLDHDEELLMRARDLHGHSIAFHQRPAEATGLATGSVDKMRFDRILQHVADHAPVLAEVQRVLKPGGLLQVVDADYLSLSFFLPDLALERKLLDALAQRFPGSRPLRHLPDSLHLLGFGKPTINVLQLLVYGFDAANTLIRLDKVVHEQAGAGSISPAELAVWEAWKTSDRCFFSINHVIIQARKEA